MPNGPSRIGITSNANDRAQPPIAVRRRPVQETQSQTSNSTQRGCDAIRDSRICMLQTLTADPHPPDRRAKEGGVIRYRVPANRKDHKIGGRTAVASVPARES